MSYCGTCGGFYNPSCTRWPGCAPAPNPHEEKIANLIVHAVATVAEIAGMLAENQFRERHGPELLAALKESVRLWDKYYQSLPWQKYPDIESEECGPMQKARAIIARAEGVAT